jgi:hypothetical protein
MNQQVVGSNPSAGSTLTKQVFQVKISRLRIFWEGFPSGQRGQTVNLLAQPSEVRILPPPPDTRLGRATAIRRKRGCSSMVEPQPSKLMMWVRFPSPAPGVAGRCGRPQRPLAGSVGENSRVPVTAPGMNTSIAHIAQSVEHFLGKEEVTGSNPVVGSSFGAGSVRHSHTAIESSGVAGAGNLNSNSRMRCQQGV